MDKMFFIISQMGCFILSLFLSIATQNNSMAEYPPSDSMSKTSDAEDRQEMKEGYYIIAGVFSNYENAQNYSKKLTTEGYDSDYTFSVLNNKYYTYLFYTESFDQIKNKYTEIKEKPIFNKAWLLQIKDHSEAKITTEPASNNETEVNTASHHHKHSHFHHHKDLTATHNTYKLFVNVHDGNFKEIPAGIKVINVDKAAYLTSLHSHKIATLSYPKNQHQTIRLVCEVFGFHKTIFDLNLKDPINSQTMSCIKKQGDSIIVNLGLQKYEKGDIMVMYNVFFYSNSNAMRQKSTYELQTLIKMLKENPTLKIKIHGHTNGRSYGSITQINEESDNYFLLEDYTITHGTSTKLSLLRANTIKRYLVSNGLSGDRIEIKGWGGKKMIHHEDAPLSEYNMRVEVEIIEE